MDRVLFIVPPHIIFNDFVNPSSNMRAVNRNGRVFGSVLTDMPIGVLSLNSYIKKHADVETKLIDFNVRLNQVESFPHESFGAFFHEELSGEEWVSFSPTVVAISALFSTSFRSVIEIADVCRKLFPAAFISAGGGVPTNMYRELFANTSSFDALCYGEGEIPLLSVLQAQDKKAAVEAHPSWITASKFANGIKFSHSFVEQLDEIPIFDYKLCDGAAYGLNPAITAYGTLKTKEMNFHVMTSRGCPHQCCFCASHTVHGRKMRYHSLDWVRKTLVLLRDVHGAKSIVFQDDHFMADRKRFLTVIDMVRELGITAIFQNSLALYALDREVLEALKSAGVEQLVLSIESGSNRVLREVMHKPLDLNIVKRVAADCRALGIYTNANILIGLPGETKQDIDDAISFLKTAGANWYMILCATPLMGSEMFEICRNKGYIKGDFIDCDFRKAIIETEDFDATWLQEKAYLMNLELNFVENADFRMGNYAVALKGFEKAIKAKPDHVLAFHFAGKCHEKLGHPQEAEAYRAKVAVILKESEFWRQHFNRFNLNADC